LLWKVYREHISPLIAFVIRLFLVALISHGVAQGQGNRLNERCLHRRATFLLRYRKHRLFSDTRRWKAFGKVTYGLQYIAKVFYRSIYR
jgi:hypothetical protein